MIEQLDIHSFLDLQGRIPVIDVRSPGEYNRAHIPGAFSLPIFEDAERAEVGTLYKQESRNSAIMAGLRIVGPKLESIVKQARSIAQDGKIIVHCWRGGMRSESIAWLLNTGGFDQVYVLQGGYKAFRKEVLETFGRDRKMWILGGMTGTGKTDILKAMQEKGEQIIDLEGLANHKGSAFGGIGQLAQPTSEHFENLLFSDLQKTTPEKTLWLENESHNLGLVNIPITFFEKMKEAQVLHLDLSREIRAERLAREYGDQNLEELAEGIQKIRKRLGAEKVSLALDYLKNGQMKEVAILSLEYYDKYYEKGLSKREPDMVSRHRLEEDHPQKNAELVIQLLKEICLKQLRQAQSN